MEKRNQAAKLLIGLVIVVFAVLLIGGLVGGKDLLFCLDRTTPLTRSDVTYKTVDAPKASSKDGTINAADWAAAYPEIAATMGDNKKNSYIVDYLDQDPYLKNIYEGFGFAKEYGSARGHEYCLEDVAHTARPKPLANCLTCKTPNFAKLVNDQGLLHLPRQRGGRKGQAGGDPQLCDQGPGGERPEDRSGHPVLRPVPYRVLLHPCGQGDHDAL